MVQILWVWGEAELPRVRGVFITRTAVTPIGLSGNPTVTGSRNGCRVTSIQAEGRDTSCERQ